MTHDDLDKYNALILQIKEMVTTKPPTFEGLYRLMLEANRKARSFNYNPPYSSRSIKEVKARDSNIFAVNRKVSAKAD